MNYKVIVLVAMCIAVVCAAGCTSTSSNGALKSVPVPQAAPDFYKGADARADGDSIFVSEESASVSQGMNQGTGSGSAAPGTAIETKIIKTGFVTIEVRDVTGSVEALKSLVVTKNGYVSSSSISEGYNKRLSGSVVLRVPASEFDATLAGVKAIGTVKSVSTQGQDVTEEYVDLQAQKTSYENQLAQYNQIMKRATNVSDVIEIQQQIDRVQTKLNQLEGRLRYLNSRIDLSTITVSLQEPEPLGGESGPSFISALNEGIAGFFGMIYGMIVIALTLLPLIIFCAVVYGIYRWRKGRQPVTAPAEPSEKK